MPSASSIAANVAAVGYVAVWKAFVQFYSAHFNALYDAGIVTENDAEALFAIANGMTNAAILSGLEDGIMAYNDNQLSDEEIAMLVAMASVGVQRNIISSDDIGLISTN